MQMSSIKLGLSVAWPAFWTGIPVKLPLVLLFLSMGMHPWEGAGLTLLALLSIPIDIWALNITAKTVFIERLRVQPAGNVGLNLWWQSALLSAIYLPLAYVMQTSAVAGAKAVTHAIMELGPIKALPVAERIGMELTLWSTPATLVLIALGLGWLFLFGKIVGRQAKAGSPSDLPYQALVRQWDLMRVPADQTLMLTALGGTAVVVIFLFWAAIPVTTPHPHESYAQPEAKVAPPFKPAEALQKTEKMLAQAETTVQALEEKAEAEAKGKEKGKGAAGQPAKVKADEPKGAAAPAKAPAEPAKGLAPTPEDHKH